MFRVDIATAVAGFFLRQAEDQELNDLILMKLMYLAERDALVTMGAPMTGARYASLPKGPVLSEVLSLMTGERRDEIWLRHIEFIGFDGRISNRCRLVNSIESEEFLSDEELRILNAIWSKYRFKNKWELVDLTHTFPEWDKSVARATATKKSVPIELYDILVKGFDVPESQAESQAANISYFESM